MFYFYSECFCVLVGDVKLFPDWGGGDRRVHSMVELRYKKNCPLFAAAEGSVEAATVAKHLQPVHRLHRARAVRRALRMPRLPSAASLYTRTQVLGQRSI
jgi:hypothetical protein